VRLLVGGERPGRRGDVRVREVRGRGGRVEAGLEVLERQRVVADLDVVRVRSAPTADRPRPGAREGALLRRGRGRHGVERREQRADAEDGDPADPGPLEQVPARAARIPGARVVRGLPEISGGVELFDADVGHARPSPGPDGRITGCSTTAHCWHAHTLGGPSRRRRGAEQPLRAARPEGGASGRALGRRPAAKAQLPEARGHILLVERADVGSRRWRGRGSSTAAARCGTARGRGARRPIGPRRCLTRASSTSRSRAPSRCGSGPTAPTASPRCRSPDRVGDRAVLSEVSGRCQPVRTLRPQGAAHPGSTRTMKGAPTCHSP